MLQSRHISIYRCCHFAILGLLCVLLLNISGCTSHRYAGAPTPSYDIDADLAQLAEKFKTATTVDNYYKDTPPTPEKRNRVIAGRLVMIDLQYLKWLRTMTADKQLLDTSADALTISLSLAATLTGGEMAKSVLSALAAGVTGIKASVDKHYYYDKTIPALGAAMNAQRKTVLACILVGMNKSLEKYSFEQGLADLNDYYQAGTLMGAVTAIQADAGAKEQKADETIKKLTKPSEEEKAAVTKVKAIITKISDTLPDPDKAKLYKALSSLGIEGINTAAAAKLSFVKLLQGDPNVRDVSATEILNAIKIAGYTVED